MEENDNTNFISSINENSIIPLKGSVLLKEEKGLKIYKYPEYEFNQENQKMLIRILLLGQTGVGKTSLINSFVNYLMDVKYNDNFRYKLIDDQLSQTKEVTAYNIRTPDGKLYQVIDTPGYWDQKGKINPFSNEKIKEYILNRLNEINAICLVVKSSDNLLAYSEKHIVDEIFYSFGEDTKDSFLTMLTFCEGGKLAVLSSLQDESFIFHKILKVKKDSYFKFNNTSFFEKEVNNFLNLSSWNISIGSFKRFMQKLDTLPSIKLDQTKKVFYELDKLGKKFAIFDRNIKEVQYKIEFIKGILKMISDLKEEINQSKNFTKKIKVSKLKKVAVIERGKYMMTCLVCNKTCYRNSTIKDDDEKFKCGCFKNGYCTVCKNKCHWTEHKNRPYELVEFMDEVVVTLEDLRKKYYDSQNHLSVKIQILKGVLNEMNKLKLDCDKNQQEIMKSINILKEIILDKSSLEPIEEELEKMKEKLENNNIEYLNKEKGMENFEDFIESYDNGEKCYIL